MQQCRKTRIAIRFGFLLLVANTAFAQTPVGEAGAVIGPSVFALFQRAFSTHGVAADENVIFVAEGFFEPQVHVMHRLTHEPLGSLPEPENGFGWPFYVRLRNVERLGVFGSRGELVLLDSPPSEAFGLPYPSYIHVYRYEYRPWSGFKVELVATHEIPLNTSPPNLPPNGIVFPSSFAFLPDGNVAVIDLFSLWVTDATFSNWRMGWTSVDFGLETYCSTVTAPNGAEVPGFYVAVRDENWNKVRISYQLRVPFPEPVLPAFKGVTYVGLTDQVAIIRVQTPGGIFAIDRTVLLDDTTPPSDKPYSVLVEPEIGLSDLSGDLVYDSYHPDSEWVYWQRAPSESGQNQCENAHPYSEKWAPIYRVNVRTGSIELVAESWMLYDFPTVLSVVQPMGSNNPFTYLVSSNVVEPRVAGVNVLAESTHLVPPTIVPIVLVGAY